MKNKSQISLPKMMPGSVHRQLVKCGKASCKCARGELHGPYHYHFIRTAGKLTKRYLKAHEIKEVKAGCRARHEQDKARSEQMYQARQLLREIDAQMRAIKKQLGY